MKLMDILKEMKAKPGNLIKFDPDYFNRVIIKINDWDLAFKLTQMGLRPTDPSDAFNAIDLGPDAEYFYIGRRSDKSILLSKKHASIIAEHGGLWPDHEEEIIDVLQNREYIKI